MTQGVKLLPHKPDYLSVGPQNSHLNAAAVASASAIPVPQLGDGTYRQDKGWLQLVWHIQY